MNDLPDFTGQVVVLYVTNAARPIQDGVVVEYAEFKSMCDRLFITGRVPEIGNDAWVSNLQTAIAWESVQSYLIFRSREDYINRMPKGSSLCVNITETPPL
jgi:hypothetical protein